MPLLPLHHTRPRLSDSGRGFLLRGQPRLGEDRTRETLKPSAPVVDNPIWCRSRCCLRRPAEPPRGHSSWRLASCAPVSSAALPRRRQPGMRIPRILLSIHPVSTGSHQLLPGNRSETMRSATRVVASGNLAVRRPSWGGAFCPTHEGWPRLPLSTAPNSTL